mmetsp:Transcript_1081/g.4583  ORF Transcript_1081/g.4583 Transcript_1081/m.4583 type:complete len:225 (-) Transcript_1081:545-1219(-)
MCSTSKTSPLEPLPILRTGLYSSSNRSRRNSTLLISSSTKLFRGMTWLTWEASVLDDAPMWKRTACSMFSPQELCSSSLKKASMSTCHSAGRPVSFLVCLSTVTWWWCCTLKGPVIWMSGADMVPMLPVLSVLLPRSLPPSSERVSADPKPVTIPRTLSDMVCRRALTGRGGLRNPAPGLVTVGRLPLTLDSRSSRHGTREGDEALARGSLNAWPAVLTGETPG